MIKDEENMKMFIKFLVYTLKTFDGQKNSAENIINLMNIQKQ